LHLVRGRHVDDSSRTDTKAELELVQKIAKEAGAFDAVICSHWADGGKGAVGLGEAVAQASKQSAQFKFLYNLQLPLDEKIRIIAREIYGADDIELSEEAQKRLALYTKQVKHSSRIVSQVTILLFHRGSAAFPFAWQKPIFPFLLTQARKERLRGSRSP
jgi:formyltetrahydrofolate synthetase